MTSGDLPPGMWTDEQLREAARRSWKAAQARRDLTRGDVYDRLFIEYRAAVTRLLDLSSDLLNAVDVASTLLADFEVWEALGHIRPVPIVRTFQPLGGVRIAGDPPDDPAFAVDGVTRMLNAVDKQRFPWLAEERNPTPTERYGAILATASLMATDRYRAIPRQELGRADQKAIVAEVRKTLADLGYIEQRPGTETLPAPGTMWVRTRYAERPVDVLLTRTDGTPIGIRCVGDDRPWATPLSTPVTNTNIWRNEAPTLLPLFVLTGTFDVADLREAQDYGVRLVWSDDLNELNAVLASDLG